MDQSGFLVSMGEDRQLQPSLAGRTIDASCPEQQIRYASQPRSYPHGPVATQVDSALSFQQATSRQHFDQQQFSFPCNQSQLSLTPNQASEDLLTAILAHPGLANYRDSVCSYLRMTPGLWNELYKPQASSPDHSLLIRCLTRQHGKLPDELWVLVSELRGLHQFRYVQDHLITTISSIATAHNQPDTPSESGSIERRFLGDHGSGSAFYPSEETSPILFHICSPAAGHSSQTTATTPISTENSRRQSQSPFTKQKPKGRAPKGESYKCPYTNCKHDPFKNAGNFSNHMASVHAESAYGNRNPTDFLMPDLSPQPSNQGDGGSSAATSAGDSPVSFRRISQDFSSGDMKSGSRDGLRGIGNDIYPIARAAYQASFMQGVFDHEESQQSLSVNGLPSSSLLGSMMFTPSRHQAQPNGMTFVDPNSAPVSSPAETGPVGFGEFQMLENQRWGMGRNG